MNIAKNEGKIKQSTLVSRVGLIELVPTICSCPVYPVLLTGCFSRGQDALYRGATGDRPEITR
ncbi:MAG: hypothetical protein AABZ02_02740 [Bacteroidota bacterium]